MRANDIVFLFLLFMSPIVMASSNGEDFTKFEKALGENQVRFIYKEIKSGYPVKHELLLKRKGAVEETIWKSKNQFLDDDYVDIVDIIFDIGFNKCVFLLSNQLGMDVVVNEKNNGEWKQTFRAQILTEYQEMSLSKIYLSDINNISFVTPKEETQKSIASVQDKIGIMNLKFEVKNK